MCLRVCLRVCEDVECDACFVMFHMFSVSVHECWVPRTSLPAASDERVSHRKFLPSATFSHAFGQKPQKVLRKRSVRKRLSVSGDIVIVSLKPLSAVGRKYYWVGQEGGWAIRQVGGGKRTGEWVGEWVSEQVSGDGRDQAGRWAGRLGGWLGVCTGSGRGSLLSTTNGGVQHRPVKPTDSLRFTLTLLYSLTESTFRYPGSV